MHQSLRHPSKFTPKMPSSLEFVFNIVTHKQYKALIALSYNEDTVIKKADEGSNVVIQNRNYYSEEG